MQNMQLTPTALHWLHLMSVKISRDINNSTEKLSCFIFVFRISYNLTLIQYTFNAVTTCVFRTACFFSTILSYTLKGLRPETSSAQSLCGVRKRQLKFVF